MGSKVSPFAFQASDFAQASTGQDGGQAGFRGSGFSAASGGEAASFIEKN